jgi:tetratricopeptide (TPR) repeat protein
MQTRRWTRGLITAAVVCLTLATNARAGHAAEPAAVGADPAIAAAAAKFSEEGVVLYKARDYRHAAEKFLQAYPLNQDPNLLFNIARCYEALGDVEAAIEKYEAFVATPDADPQGKRRAGEAVRALRLSKPVTSAAASSATARDGELAATGSARSASASAAADARFSELSAEGLAFYKSRDYRRAAERFLQAYAFDPEPNLLFNVARCYAALGDAGSAIEKYEAYLKEPGIDEKGRAHAQAALRTLRQAKTEAPAPVVTAPSNGGERGDAAEGTATGRGRIIAGWVTTALLTAGTVTMGLLTLDSANKLKTARATFPGDPSDLSSRRSRTTTLSLSTDALGVASAVMAGLSLYWTISGPSSSSSPSTSSTELRAGIGPGSLRITGSF